MILQYFPVFKLSRVLWFNVIQRLCHFFITKEVYNARISVLHSGICEVFASVLRENGVRSTRCPYEDLEPDHVYSWTADVIKDLDAMFKELIVQASSAKTILKENGIWYL